MAGIGKLVGTQMHVDGFTKWKLPQWFRFVTGLVETVAAVILILGFWKESLTIYGAVLLIIVAVGGIITHVRIKDSMKDMLPISILGLLALILAILLYF